MHLSGEQYEIFFEFTSHMNLAHRAVSQQVCNACIDAPRSLEMHKKLRNTSEFSGRIVELHQTTVNHLPSLVLGSKE